MWLNVGDNQAVTYGGAQAETQIGGGLYDDPDGRKLWFSKGAIRITLTRKSYIAIRI
jgi:hypothetical protein